MKRICVLLNNPYAPDNRVFRQITSLRDAGYRIDLFAVHANDFPKYEQTPGLNIYRILKKLPKYAPFSRLSFQALVKIAKYGRYDFVHAHDANMLPLGYMLSRMWGAKLVYDSHEYWDSLFEEQYKKLLNKNRARKSDIKNLERFQKFESWTLARCDAVISVNQSICDLLQRKAMPQIPLCIPIRNIPPYFNPMSPPGEKPRRFHQEFQLPSETSVVLYQGGIVEKRGISILLEVAEQLENVAFVLMGPADDAYLRKIFTRVCLSPKLRQSVFYKEAVPPHELLFWTSSADLGIHPILNTEKNHYYCLPNKIFEYIQAGIPVLASDFPEMRHIIDSFNIGFTFDPEDSIEIAGKINRFLSDPSLRDIFSRNLIHAKQALCWEHEALKLISLYAQLAGCPDTVHQHDLQGRKRNAPSDAAVLQ